MTLHGFDIMRGKNNATNWKAPVTVNESIICFVKGEPMKRKNWFNYPYAGLKKVISTVFCVKFYNDREQTLVSKPLWRNLQSHDYGYSEECVYSSRINLPLRHEQLLVLGR